MSTDLTPTRTPVSTLRPEPLAAAGAVIALGCGVVGQYVTTPWKSGPGTWDIDVAGSGGWAALALLAGFILIGLSAVTVVARRARAVAPERAARRGVFLAIVAVASLAVFWTGLPAVLAGGAASIAVGAGHRRGALPAAAAIALGLSALVTLTAIWLAFSG